MSRVDGKPVEPRGSWLDTCRDAGADVPALCKDDRLGAGGHCRACMIEVDGKFVAACSTPARAGATVVTDSEALRAYRRDLGELILSESTPGGEVARVLARLGAEGTRYGAAPRTDRRDTSHPLLSFEADRCILCRRCLKACEEIQGQFVFAIEGRGASAHLAWGGGPFAGTDCVACGACVTACPTEALGHSDLGRAARLGPPEREHVTRTTCGHCAVGCGLDVHVAGEGPAARIAHVEGDPGSPVNAGHLCVEGRFAHGFVHHPDRLTVPLVRRGGALEPATWDEALGAIAAGFTRLRGHIAALAGARCTNEEGYLLQKWFRGGLGTHDVNGHAPASAEQQPALGADAATGALADIELADFLLLAGGNAAAAHPVAQARLRQAALRGTPLVVIDPRRSELAALADVHLAPRQGTDVPLLHALASVLVTEDLVDHAFLAARAEGWQEYRAFLAAYSPEASAGITGVPAEQVRRAARLLGRAQRPLLCHGAGSSEPQQEGDALSALVNLALLRGAFGRAGAGLLGLRGRSNSQGTADVGCRPDRTTGGAPVDDAGARARAQAVWGRPLPAGHGRELPALFAAAEAGELKALFVLGDDPLRDEPLGSRVRAAFGALELLVVQELFLTETAMLAHVVLPAASFLEKDGTFTNLERRVQRVRAVLPPPGEARPDWRILCDLMAATGWPQAYAGPADVLDEIARMAPEFAGLSSAHLEPHGRQWPVPAPGHPGTATRYTEGFEHGRALLACVPFTPSDADGTPADGRAPERSGTGAMARRSGLGGLAPDGRR